MSDTLASYTLGLVSSIRLYNVLLRSGVVKSLVSSSDYFDFRGVSISRKALLCRTIPIDSISTIPFEFVSSTLLHIPWIHIERDWHFVSAHKARLLSLILQQLLHTKGFVINLISWFLCTLFFLILLSFLSVFPII